MRVPVGLTLAFASVLVTATFGACGGGPGEGYVTLVMHDNYFEPAEIRIPAGETVTIVAKNRGRLIHNVSVVETPFHSDTVVNAGRESRFDVTFVSPGTYAFQCDYHLPGMIGAFIVE